ncbi:hypothetical protein CEXT_595181 [Caerostris extrusa]|uniref:Uncharacterized protein n=1 Tax=Caerostris extrusa TaxID=172846 RepID=A0AAV4PJY6_CAEEX|nr:hypothetical protein CEXT_595181 [Caerostris extrusa]
MSYQMLWRFHWFRGAQHQGARSPPPPETTKMSWASPPISKDGLKPYIIPKLKNFLRLPPKFFHSEAILEL